MDEATGRVADLERRVAALEERSRKASVATAEAQVREVDRVLAEHLGRHAELEDWGVRSWSRPSRRSAPAS
jgi:hypothetical protein